MVAIKGPARIGRASIVIVDDTCSIEGIIGTISR